MRSPLAATILATTRDAAWAPILVFTVHMIASRGLGLYGPYPWLDVPMHAAGGIAIAYFFHRALVLAGRHGVLAPFHALTHVLFVLALVGTTTVLWEFAEFLSDRYLGTHAQAGLGDTLLDMLLGIAGGAALVGALALRAGTRRVSLDRVGDGARATEISR
ncbi:MAG: hypothetical protein EPO68_08550 [Planctomycetota bacterium]|nr:MAG: hypothetical protein EPO68_08550 [Planctomycetota bacterium]